jgi:hypothetical protein
MWVTVVILVIFAFSIALVLVLPHREVTQPAGRWQFVWELLAPGTSPGWGWLGGLVLVLWMYFVVQACLLFLGPGTPYIIAAITTPNITRAYAVPLPGGHSGLFKFINPSWVWLYLAPAALFLVNLVMVLRSRRT